ncbi:MAG: YjbF family lipoprotein [Rhodobacteraceae bacterium]|nr:YjbF family lipoprotein [Paracoccaceae bacterium]
MAIRLRGSPKAAPAPGAFANDYWVENGGEVRQSRQWVGPTVGFLELQRLDG